MVLVLTFALTACSAPPTSGDSTAHSASSVPSSNGSDHSSDVPSRDDLRDEHAVQWTQYEQLDDQTIRVHFTLGTPTCYGARAAVRESDTTVEIAVSEGLVPGAPKQCTLEAVFVSMVVTTAAPIAGRTVTQP